VLIRRPDGSVDAPSITVSGDGEFALSDANGEQVLKAAARRHVVVGREGDAFWIQDGDQRRSGLPGPIRVNGTGDGAPLRNQATSSGEPTPFRGTLEITASPDGAVALVNVLGIEDYLYGVVTKELPASFGAEPLKAQAVAARSYAIARREMEPHKNQSADICDTQHCQVFGSLAGEHAAGHAAVDATAGQVLYAGGAIFAPFYSSACGGHTEAAARVFGDGDASAEQDAVADGDVPGGLGSDDGALQFYKTGWDSNCSESNTYRWSVSWDGDQLKSLVASGIQRFRGSQTVAASAPDAKLDQLENVSVPARGPSGRALAVRFEAPGASWTVKPDWGIRNFLRTPSGDLLPSSAIAFEIERGSDLKITSLRVYGAGLGHGSGMCQWGTKRLAARGLAFDGILNYYYPSAELKQVPTA
jgi:stage II sporulation protein D